MLRIAKHGIFHLSNVDNLKTDYYVTKDDYNYIYFNRHEIHKCMLDNLGEDVNISYIREKEENQ